MNLSFKNRIAFYYLFATAVIVSIVFVIIYIIVQTTMYRNLDYDLSFEANKHTTEIFIEGDSIKFAHKAEWEEREHREVRVNPVFIQIINKDGEFMDKSPNLKEDQLPFRQDQSLGDHFNAFIGGQAIRQVQMPIIQGGVTEGYILAAMSLESSKMVIANLRNVLLILYPLVLVALFLITRYLAGRSILPIKRITETADRITRKNLNERIELPRNKDELFVLTSSINELLLRIQHAVERERQFTSDASHELRTPLSVLRGTLEVLIRKLRSPEEYQEKIRSSLREIDRMTVTIDQLLLLARFDGLSHPKDIRPVQLVSLVDDVLQRNKAAIEEKQLEVSISDPHQAEVQSDPYCVDLILENIISNAVKYSPPCSAIQVRFVRQEQRVVCQIIDKGIGIRQEDIVHLTNPFFRSDALNHKQIQGNGLGLSIVKKACDFIQAELSIESQLQRGTTVSVIL
uniref:histidine kinase n=1 Tax=Roseihalotalea indica TaxID=2867963 RepID=A0AA49JFE0_9BACT|nr:ATP-binding protein [Tunicatimonas sp. TK19036]